MPNYTDPAAEAGLLRQSSGNAPALLPGVIIALVAGVIALLGAGFFFFQVTSEKDKATTLQTQITTDQQRITALQPVVTQLATLTQQANGLHATFDNQKRWEAILGTLETGLYKNLSVSDVSAQDNGQLTITGLTATYTDYAKIFASLTDASGQKYFSQVKPLSITKIDAKDNQPGGIQFSFSLTLQPVVLNAQTALTRDQVVTP